MGIIDVLDDTSSKAAQSGEKYVHTSKKYYELKVFQQLAILSTTGFKLALYGVLCTLCLVFTAVALALALGTYYDNLALGYLTVGGLFFVLICIVYLLRKRFEKAVVQKLSENFFDS